MTHTVIRVVVAAVIFPRSKKVKKAPFRLEKKLPVKLWGEQSCQVAGQGKPPFFDPGSLPQSPEVLKGSRKPAFDQGADLFRVSMEPG